MKGISMIRFGNRESGAVSLFVVIFAMLLITVATISFLRIMVDDQNRATGSDLAQSAFDSAQAGVEDAKRALVWYLECEKGVSTSINCDRAKDIVSSLECNEAIKESGVVTVGVGDTEIKVQQSSVVSADGNSQDAALDQAYTCVKINLDSDDYLAHIPANQSIIVPLVGAGDFNRVVLEWFSKDDMTSTDGVVDVPKYADVKGDMSMLKQGSWPNNRPSLMRAQFMQTGEEFTLSQFDYVDIAKYRAVDDFAGRRTNGGTVFLYPTSDRYANSAVAIAGDVRAEKDGVTQDNTGSRYIPRAIECTNVASGGYSCKAHINLPNPMDGGSYNNRFLRLTAFYKASHIRLTLVNNNTPNDPTSTTNVNPVKFQAVQPVVDSTGRASNVFRRVESRIELYDTLTFPYPDAAVDVSKSFCKDFGVTNDAYVAGVCEP